MDKNKVSYEPPTSQEVERLIHCVLLNKWDGDDESHIGRIIEILRHTAADTKVKVFAGAHRHTKRTPGFSIVVDSIIHRLHMAIGMGVTTQGLLEDVTNVLINNTTDTGCVVKAENDEPIFVLRGKDKIASACVLMWAAMAAEVGAGEGKVQDAMDCAGAMKEYHTRSFPT